MSFGSFIEDSVNLSISLGRIQHMRKIHHNFSIIYDAFLVLKKYETCHQNNHIRSLHQISKLEKYDTHQIFMQGIYCAIKSITLS